MEFAKDHIKLFNSDCITAMKQLPDNSIDSIVTDPPYGLSFMGKHWDYDVPGIDVWKEAYRVLKPGGHLLSFGGTRTYHRMACAIEDAGFQVRDMIQWIYGCLSEDTEILTINGWEHYHKAIELHPVLCYNIDKDTFEFCKPERSFIYENKHTAYRIQSDYTDQIVSRNHRCIIERGGRKVFAYAETLEQQESVPVLESLHDLPESIPNIYEGTSIKKQDLLKRVRQQECRQEEHRENPARVMRRQSTDNLCGMRETGVESQGMDEKSGNTYLQSSMQRNAERAGMEATRTQRQGKLDGRIREVGQEKNVGTEQPCMEGWRNLFQNTRKLCWCKVCSLSRRICGNVKKRRLCDGTPFNSCANTGKMLKEVGGGTPYRPQPSQQRTEQFNAFCEQSTAQKVRSNRKTRTTLATITPIEYHGNVWCVQVPTGAFVARRNGHIFITGNSGFPKSMDISKAIDKKFGAEREVVGKSKRHGGGKNFSSFGESLENNPHPDITAPSTEEAKQYSGWGTALKPANEPIVVARKPLSEKTVAENVLKWGTGGINIDGCRVATNETRVGNPDKSNCNSVYGKGWQKSGTTPPQGRFPANVIHDGSEVVLREFPNGGAAAPVSRGMNGKSKGIYGDFAEKGDDGSSFYNDSGSVARFFYCAKASKSERERGLDEFALRVKQTQMRGANGTGEKNFEGGFQDQIMRNTHPTVKPMALMRYLCRMVTPKGGTVLDPFMGSGTTGIAAKVEGYSFIGIEREEEYCKIAEARIAAWEEEKIVIDTQQKLF